MDSFPEMYNDPISLLEWFVRAGNLIQAKSL